MEVSFGVFRCLPLLVQLAANAASFLDFLSWLIHPEPKRALTWLGGCVFIQTELPG